MSVNHNNNTSGSYELWCNTGSESHQFTKVSNAYIHFLSHLRRRRADITTDIFSSVLPTIMIETQVLAWCGGGGP